MAERKAKLTRQTKETQVDVEINLDGTGESSIDTPNGMFNHLLEQLARHGLLDISVSAKGDLSPGWHHLVEDVAIVLGQCIHQAIGDGKGITRMGHMTIPLDETLVLVAVDLGGRPYPVIKATFDSDLIGDLPSDLIRHFLEVFAIEGRLNLHAQILSGINDHHKAEALFKALARSLRQAVAIDSRSKGEIPSTKGTIGE